MARTRRLTGPWPTPNMKAALAALCISGLLFATLLLGMRRVPMHGADRLRVVHIDLALSVAATSLSDISSTIKIAKEESVKHSAIDDAENFYYEEKIENVLPARSVPTESEPSDSIALTPAVESVTSGYLPAKLLSLRPVIMEDIDPNLPVGMNAPDQTELTLQLLINEYGDVDRVIVDTGILPVFVMNELTQRFLHLRFFPGRLDGRAVPTALRIAVTLQADEQP